MVIRLGGKITPEYTFKKWDGTGMGWIDMAQVRVRLQVLMNAVMNFRGP
jgi:hypothetical protein